MGCLILLKGTKTSNPYTASIATGKHTNALTQACVSAADPGQLARVDGKINAVKRNPLKDAFKKTQGEYGVTVGSKVRICPCIPCSDANLSMR